MPQVQIENLQKLAKAEDGAPDTSINRFKKLVMHKYHRKAQQQQQKVCMNNSIREY